ncbi:MAG: hypothetical protein CSA70_09645 [Rhodobacterales bacterium]|nr:MAG: hypothetical protein CSA70_09645 [Rhodobacterales bacterium]
MRVPKPDEKHKKVDYFAPDREKPICAPLDAISLSGGAILGFGFFLADGRYDYAFDLMWPVLVLASVIAIPGTARRICQSLIQFIGRGVTNQPG